MKVITKISLLMILFMTTPVIASYQMPIDITLRIIEMETGCKMKVTSGHRTKAHNKRVGGAKHSYHLKDMARDIVPVKRGCISLKKLAKIACKYTTTISYHNHVHIDSRKQRKCFRGMYK